MIAVLGYNGFVGQYVYNCLRSVTKDVVGYGKGDVWGCVSYSIVFDCRAFFSKRLCHEDSIIDDGVVCDTNKYVLVSSIEASDVKSVYGWLKSKQEKCARSKYDDKLTVIRCGSIFGPGLKRGPVYDAMNGKTYISDDSKLRLTKISDIVIAGFVSGDINSWSNDYVTPVQLREHYKISSVNRLGDRLEDYSFTTPSTDYTVQDVLNG